MAPVAVLLSLLTNCVFCLNADWTYGYSSTERTSMLASGTPESQWCPRSPSPTRLCLELSHAQQTLEATYASLQQTELLAGVIHEQDCRAIRTACCCLNSLRIRVEARANVIERAVISRQLQLMQASVQLRSTEDLNTADTSCPSRTSAEHFDDKTGPCLKNWTLQKIFALLTQAAFLNLCRTFYLNQQLLLKELHACKPASMLSS